MRVALWLIDEHDKFIDRQNQEMKKISSKAGGKQSVSNLAQLKHIPGVQVIRKKK